MLGECFRIQRGVFQARIVLSFGDAWKVKGRFINSRYPQISRNSVESSPVLWHSWRLSSWLACIEVCHGLVKPQTGCPKLDAGYPESQTKKLFQKCWVNGRWMNTYIFVKVLVTLLGKMIFKRGTPTLSQRKKKISLLGGCCCLENPAATGQRQSWWVLFNLACVKGSPLVASNCMDSMDVKCWTVQRLPFQSSHLFCQTNPLGNPKKHPALFSADV